MAVIQPPGMTQPPVAPQRKDRNTFANRVDAFLTWMISAVAQFLALAQNVWNNANEAYNASVQAVSAAGTAVAAASSAAVTANATLFNATTNYAQGQAVISLLNPMVFRRRTAGVSATDPSLDPANWQRAINDPFSAVDVLSISGDTTLSQATKNIVRVTSTVKNAPIRLPAATTILNSNGTYLIRNSGTLPLPVRDSTGVLLAVLPGGSSGIFGCEDFTTAAGVWLVVAPENLGSIATGAATVWTTASCNWIGTSAIPGATDKALVAWAGSGMMYAAIATRDASGGVTIGAVASIGDCANPVGAMCVALSTNTALVASANPSAPNYTLYALTLNLGNNTIGIAGSKLLGAIPNMWLEPQPQVVDASRAAWLYGYSNGAYMVVAQHNGAAAPTFSVTSLDNSPGSTSACLAHVGNGNLLVVGFAGASLYVTSGTTASNTGTRPFNGQNPLETSNNGAAVMFSQGGNRAAVVTGAGGATGGREKTFTLLSSGGMPGFPNGHRHFPSGSSSYGPSCFTGAVIGTTYCTIGTTIGARGCGLRLMRYANDALYEFAYGWPDDLPFAGAAAPLWRAAGVNGQNAIVVSLDTNSWPQVAALEVCKA